MQNDKSKEISEDFYDHVKDLVLCSTGKKISKVEISLVILEYSRLLDKLTTDNDIHIDIDGL